MLKGTTMNAKLKRVALTLSGALFATSALAGGGNYPPADTQPSTRTRAEVQAELKASTPLVRGDVYPVLELAPSQRSREEVRAEAVRAKPVQPTA
jgi:hypothetical protein